MNDKRQTIYLVQREDGVVCGAFMHVEDADEYAASYAQQMLEKTGFPFEFEVTTTTLYQMK